MTILNRIKGMDSAVEGLLVALGCFAINFGLWALVALSLAGKC